MKKLLILLLLLFITSIRYAWCEDNVLAVDVIDNKKEAPVEAEDVLSTDQAASMAPEPAREEPEPLDESEVELDRIKAFHELFDTKQKELEIIRLDLEKSNLLLKKKEVEKEIYQIEQALPQARREETSLGNALIQETKEPFFESSDMRIEFLLISDDLKEGQVSMKGSTYSFREGDSIVSNLTVEKIDPFGVTFSQPDGNTLKLNFIN